MIALIYDFEKRFILGSKIIIITKVPSENIFDKSFHEKKFKNTNSYDLYIEISCLDCEEVFLDFCFLENNYIYFNLSHEYENYFYKTGLYKISMIDYNNFISLYCIEEDAKNWIIEGF